MSFKTGGCADLIYETVAASTQLNTFTTEDSLLKGLPVCEIDPGYWGTAPKEATGKSLRIKAWGRLGTTGTPTFTWSVRFLTSSTFSAGGGIGFSTAALTGASGVTLVQWDLECDITLRALSSPAASTLMVMGKVTSGAGLASPFVYSIPTGNTAFTSTSFDTTVTQFLFVSVACGTSNASNLINSESVKVYGDN